MERGDLRWIADSPHWDADKARVIGAAPHWDADGALGGFDPAGLGAGDVLPGEWWRAELDGRPVAYGWMESTWGDAEMLLAVAPESRGLGVGAFVLDRLEEEAAARGLGYLYNVVPRGHPERERVAGWLRAHGFEPSHDDERLLRRVKAKSR